MYINRIPLVGRKVKKNGRFRPFFNLDKDIKLRTRAEQERDTDRLRKADGNQESIL